MYTDKIESISNACHEVSPAILDNNNADNSDYKFLSLKIILKFVPNYIIVWKNTSY